jgi:hypothetical protein
MGVNHGKERKEERDKNRLQASRYKSLRNITC